MAEIAYQKLDKVVTDYCKWIDEKCQSIGDEMDKDEALLRDGANPWEIRRSEIREVKTINDEHTSWQTSEKFQSAARLIKSGQHINSVGAPSGASTV